MAMIHGKMMAMIHGKPVIGRSCLCMSIALALLTPPAYAKDCPSKEEPAPGVRMPERPGCVDRRPQPSREAVSSAPKAQSGREPGFFQLGNGLEVRIGGRVDFEAHSRR